MQFLVKPVPLFSEPFREIAIGDTPDMVRIAKGSPHYITVRETQDVKMEAWRWTRAQHTTYTHPVQYTNRGTPIPQFVEFRQVSELEILRVDFIDGRVFAIEEIREP